MLFKFKTVLTFLDSFGTPPGTSSVMRQSSHLTPIPRDAWFSSATEWSSSLYVGETGKSLRRQINSMRYACASWKHLVKKVHKSINLINLIGIAFKDTSEP